MKKKTKAEKAKYKKAVLPFVFLHLFLYLCLLSLPAVFMPVSKVYARQENRGRAESLYRESVALFEDGNIDKAIELVREAIKADPNYPDAYNQLGYMLLKKGQIKEALDAFNLALKINPRLHSSKTGIGLALLREGDTKRAEAVLKEALILNPSPSMAHYALGLVYEKLGDYKKAIYQFKRGIKKYKSD